VIDNLKAGVIDPELYAPRPNPKLEEFAQLARFAPPSQA